MSKTNQMPVIEEARPIRILFNMPHGSEGGSHRIIKLINAECFGRDSVNVTSGCMVFRTVREKLSTIENLIKLGPHTTNISPKERERLASSISKVALLYYYNNRLPLYNNSLLRQLRVAKDGNVIYRVINKEPNAPEKEYAVKSPACKQFVPFKSFMGLPKPTPRGVIYLYLKNTSEAPDTLDKKRDWKPYTTRANVLSNAMNHFGVNFTKEERKAIVERGYLPTNTEELLSWVNVSNSLSIRLIGKPGLYDHCRTEKIRRILSELSIQQACVLKSLENVNRRVSVYSIPCLDGQGYLYFIMGVAGFTPIVDDEGSMIRMDATPTVYLSSASVYVDSDHLLEENGKSHFNVRFDDHIKLHNATDHLSKCRFAIPSCLLDGDVMAKSKCHGSCAPGDEHDVKRVLSSSCRCPHYEIPGNYGSMEFSVNYDTWKRFSVVMERKFRSDVAHWLVRDYTDLVREEKLALKEFSHLPTDPLDLINMVNHITRKTVPHISDDRIVLGVPLHKPPNPNVGCVIEVSDRDEATAAGVELRPSPVHTIHISEVSSIIEEPEHNDVILEDTTSATKESPSKTGEDSDPYAIMSVNPAEMTLKPLPAVASVRGNISITVRKRKHNDSCSSGEEETMEKENHSSHKRTKNSNEPELHHAECPQDQSVLDDSHQGQNQMQSAEVPDVDGFVDLPNFNEYCLGDLTDELDHTLEALPFTPMTPILTKGLLSPNIMRGCFLSPLSSPLIRGQTSDCISSLFE